MITLKRKRISNVGLPKNLLAAIGHVAALWSQLEYVIDRKITEILRLPGAPTANQKLIIPFNQRLKLLEELCDKYLDNEENRLHASRIILDLKQLSVQRNLIVHGSVANSKQRRKRQIVYWFRRISWDNPSKIERRSLTVSQVEVIASKISDLIPAAMLIEAFFWAVEDSLLGRSEQ